MYKKTENCLKKIYMLVVVVGFNLYDLFSTVGKTHVGGGIICHEITTQ